MSRNRVSSHVIIVNFCTQLGVEYKSMVKLIRPLLKHYFMGRSQVFTSQKGHVKRFQETSTALKGSFQSLAPTGSILLLTEWR